MLSKSSAVSRFYGIVWSGMSCMSCLDSWLNIIAGVWDTRSVAHIVDAKAIMTYMLASTTVTTQYACVPVSISWLVASVSHTWQHTMGVLLNLSLKSCQQAATPQEDL